MNRPSKKEIKSALDKIRDAKPPTAGAEYIQRPLAEKKLNKNRIRKQGV